MDKSHMLDQIKEYYNLKKDSDFARFLDVKPQVLSNWKKRNSFDAELLYQKCPDINPSWLLLGKGSMLKEKNDVTAQVQEDKSPYDLQEKIADLEEQVNVLKEANAALKESNANLKEAKDIFKQQLHKAQEELQMILKNKDRS